MSDVDRWAAGLSYEVSFWQRFLETKGAEWPDYFVNLVADEHPVSDPIVLECIRRLASPSVSVLDVGAGPVSLVGTSAGGTTIRLTAVDPLADEYAELLAGAGIVPYVRTETCQGERLLERFQPGAFDLSFARNCVDHSYDPMLVIENMLTVVRPGGFVVLKHLRNEGEREGYSGLHQWNFDLQRGRLLLWDRSSRRDVDSNLTTPALSWFGHDGDGWIVCVFQPLQGRRRARWSPRGAAFRAAWRLRQLRLP
jgi:SAM-dependent methyltransferase